LQYEHSSSRTCTVVVVAALAVMTSTQSCKQSDPVGWLLRSFSSFSTRVLEYCSQTMVTTSNTGTQVLGSKTSTMVSTRVLGYVYTCSRCSIQPKPLDLNGACFLPRFSSPQKKKQFRNSSVAAHSTRQHARSSCGVRLALAIVFLKPPCGKSRSTVTMSVAAAPSSRMAKLRQLLEKVLGLSVDSFEFQDMHACFPRLAKTKGNTLSEYCVDLLKGIRENCVVRAGACAGSACVCVRVVRRSCEMGQCASVRPR
jgi:hypothetical protein